MFKKSNIRNELIAFLHIEWNVNDGLMRHLFYQTVVPDDI